jgi:uncharacterized protein YjeT (DUF2065 family)
MKLLVVLIGVIFLLISLAILVSPGGARRFLANMVTPRLIPVLSVVRIGLGIVFVLAAPATRLPVFVWAIGLLFIFRGVAVPILGFDRAKKLVDWWMEKPDREFRLIALLGILLGALLVRAGT